MFDKNTLPKRQREDLAPVIERFLRELKAKRLFGVKSSNDGIIIPPMESDPSTGEKLHDLVPVGDQGEVLSWRWVRHPCENRPKQAYAWAIIKLDGADTPIIHRVVANAENELFNGMRVQIRWAECPKGRITDIVCFEAIKEKPAP